MWQIVFYKNGYSISAHMISQKVEFMFMSPPGPGWAFVTHAWADPSGRLGHRGWQTSSCSLKTFALKPQVTI